MRAKESSKETMNLKTTSTQHPATDAHPEASEKLLPAANGKGHGGDAGDAGNRQDQKNQKDAGGIPPGLPVDRGWAWAILIAQFVIRVVTGSCIIGQSVFLLEYASLFDVSVTTAAAPLGITLGFGGVGSIVVANVLMPRLEAKPLVLIGAFINTASLAVLALAPNIIFVCIVHIFIGMSIAITNIPSMTLLSYYFQARRSLAVSIANSGFSISVFVAPPFVQYLITAYGARGAFLLMAGVVLQVAVVGCLLRPVSAYTRRKPGKTDRVPQRQEPSNEAEASELLAAATELDVCSTGGQLRSELKSVVNDLTDYSEETETRAGAWVSEIPRNGTKPAASFVQTDSPAHVESNQEPHASPEAEESKDVLYGSQTVAAEENGPDSSRDAEGSQILDSERTDGSACDVSGPTLSKEDEIPNESASGRPTDEESVGKRRSCWSVFLEGLSNLLGLSLFRNRLFLLIVIYFPLGMSSSMTSLYFPSLGVSKGLSREDAALLPSIQGAVDLVSRLAVGYLADLELVKKTHIVALSTFLLGLATQFTNFYNSFGLLAMFAVMQGLFGTVVHNLMIVVIIDLMGLEVLSKVMGTTLLLHSLWSAANVPFVGALVDLTNSFSVPFYYIGACQILTTVVLLLEPLARRLEAKRVEKLEKDSDGSRSPVKL